MKWYYTLFFTTFLTAMVCSSDLHAQVLSVTTNSNISKIKLSGYGFFMFGQIVSGVWGDEWARPSTTFKHLWLNTCRIHLDAESDQTDWLTTKLGFELYVDYFHKGSCAMGKNNYVRQYKAYLPSIEGIMHWNFEHPIVSSLTIESGLFPYTTNRQVKTLGNYLFRSTINPVSIQNKLDYPWADFLGSIVEVGLFHKKVIIDGMLQSEFTYVPFYDFTPAFGLNYKPNKIFNIGGAVAFNHAILLGPSSNTWDKNWRKWQGTKLYFMFIFDLKPLFRGMDFLKKDQFKLYAELAFIGLKDSLEVDTSNIVKLESMDTTGLDISFPANSLLHRMPFMIGINLPTWKILDLLSIELEWFFSPYANDWFGKFDSRQALSRQPTSLDQWDNYIYKDNLKWAINIRKSAGNFELRSLIGSDHTIYHIVSIDNFEQTMKRPKDWHWFIELRYYL